MTGVFIPKKLAPREVKGELTLPESAMPGGWMLERRYLMSLMAHIAPLPGDMLPMAIARQLMTQAFKDDPDLRRSYQDKIATFLSDTMVVTERERGNQVADGIIHLIFEANWKDDDKDA